MKKRFVFPVIIIIALLSAGSVYIWQSMLLNRANEDIAILTSSLQESNKEYEAMKENADILTKKLENLKSELLLSNDKSSKLSDELSELKAILPGSGKPGEVTEREFVQASADKVLHALRNKNMQELAVLIHPEKGVRFTPYSFVNLKDDIVIKASEVESLLAGSAVKEWGAYDGTGDPIKLTFREYYDKFVYDKDFITAPQMVYNKIIQRGNSLNNINEVYPDAVFFEYHFNGFEPQYGGMDWESLKLVFEEKDGMWYLISIIHDQWTI